MKSKIIGLIDNAKRVLELDIDLTADIITNKERFATASDACVVKGNNIYVNQHWIDRMAKEEGDDETELRNLIYHEVRHIYQKKQIELFKNGQPIIEEPARVKRWDHEFNNYIKHVNGNIDYYTQEIEIDAIAFGICMFNFDIDSGVKNILGEVTSIPNEIDNLVHNRIAEIVKALNFNS